MFNPSRSLKAFELINQTYPGMSAIMHPHNDDGDITFTVGPSQLHITVNPDTGTVVEEEIGMPSEFENNNNEQDNP